MNYKTTLVITAVAVAAFVAIGSAFPVLESAFAQANPNSPTQSNTQNCATLTSGCRNQIGQTNNAGDNEAEDINFN